MSEEVRAWVRQGYENMAGQGARREGVPHAPGP